MSGESLSLFCSLEPLETRFLLSWPDAPFAGADYENTLYVNQFGDAYFSEKVLSPRGDFDGYRLHFDDPGPIVVSTRGVPAQIAYYLGTGSPARTADNPSASSDVSLRAKVPDRRLVFAGVRAVGSATGRYSLHIDGPPEGHIDTIKVSPRTHAGSDGSDINPASDYDFLKFTTTRAGVWSVTVIPDEHLDPTLNIFDAAGKPIGGSFARPINNGGVGEAETWTSRHLEKGQPVFLRIDGRGQTTGGVTVLVHYGKPATVNVNVVSGTTTEGSGEGAIVRFVRSGTATRAIPLTVNYTVGGTATPGSDYPALGGSITIPAGRTSAALVISALADDILEGDETIQITLVEHATYTLGKAKTAIVNILDQQ